jgi:hypothetical protein
LPPDASNFLFDVGPGRLVRAGASQISGKLRNIGI